MPITCARCGRAFEVYACYARRHAYKFCSDSCKAAWRYDPDRFWSRTDRSTECWLWTGTHQPGGYGRFKIGGVMWIAHRYAWLLSRGSLDAELVVCHACDVRYAPGDTTYRRCVRPDHLFAGTALSNVQDMLAKGRDRVVGARNARAILSPERVLSIRERGLLPHTDRQLAAEFGVARTTIQAIHSGRLWSPRSLKAELAPE